MGQSRQFRAGQKAPNNGIYIEIGEDLTILNPGSLSYPRQADRRPTFLIMEIDEEGEAHFGHGYYRSKFSELKI